MYSASNSHSSCTSENVENIRSAKDVQTITKQYNAEQKTQKLLPRRLSEFELELEDAMNEPLNITIGDLKDIAEEVEELNVQDSDEPKIASNKVDTVDNAELTQAESLRFVVPFTPLKEFSTPYKANIRKDSAIKNSYQNKENKVQASVPVINSAKKSKVVTSIFSTPKFGSKLSNPRSAQITQKELSLNSYKILIVKGVTYEILKELGKGGSSVVYDCFERKTRTNRAVKQVSLENRASASSFINEVKLLEKLQNCPNIIKMYDYEILESKKLLLVVLEKGTTDLAKIIRHNRNLHFHKIMSFWIEMLYAVRQIHQNGIVHCDLKPSNFVMNDEGNLKLIDFGISCSIQNDMTSAVKSVCEGSLNYIGPEALNSQTSCNPESPSFGKPQFKVNFKLDVWSLGCILYELVYKRTPFHHIVHTFAKIAVIRDPNHIIDYPNTENVDPRLINTIKKCLVYDPKNRSSIDELIRECEIV